MNGVDGVVLVVIQITDDQVPNGQYLRVQHTYGWERRLLLLDPARGEEKLMKIQQQHNGVVVVEERGYPTGLRQAPRDMRRKRGRAAPSGREQIACYGQPHATIYIGEREEGAPPLGFPPLGGRPRGGERGAP